MKKNVFRMKTCVCCRYLRRTKINKKTGCWEYDGIIDSHGYGIHHIKYKRKKVHRIMFQIFHKIDPGNLFVCHSCDNRRCINPDHLFLGTAKDNITDMVTKKRNAHGEKSPLSKITNKQCIKIKILYKKNTSKQIKEKYFPNLAESTIRSIGNGSAWRHINV